MRCTAGVAGVAVLVAWAVVAPAAAYETKGGEITRETWGPGTVYVQSKVVLLDDRSSELTILPGTVVKFAAGTGIWLGEGAVIRADGTRSQPIILTSMHDNSVGEEITGSSGKPTRAEGWDAISTTHSFAGSSVTHCRFRYQRKTCPWYQYPQVQWGFLLLWALGTILATRGVYHLANGLPLDWFTQAGSWSHVGSRCSRCGASAPLSARAGDRCSSCGVQWGGEIERRGSDGSEGRRNDTAFLAAAITLALLVWLGVRILPRPWL